MKTRTLLLGLLALLVLNQLVFAVDTARVDLREGASNDGEVSIWRDGSGNMMFEDQVTTATSLLQLAAQAVDHGTLTGLSDDDHIQYINESRHVALHDSTFNNALSISGDANSNGTIGAHVSDEEIHLSGGEAETVTGVWDFSAGVTVDEGAVRIGESQYTTDPVVAFADSPDDAEFLYDLSDDMFAINRSLRIGTIYADTSLRGDRTGSSSGSISGFTTIEGIAAADLLSSTENESISGDWSFLGGLETDTVETQALVLTGQPTISIRAINSESTAISAGNAVAWTGVDGDYATVEKLTSAVSSSTAFAGIALEDAAESEFLNVALFGVASTSGAGSISVGDLVTWNGSTFVAGTPACGHALNAVSGGGTLKIAIGSNTNYWP